MVSLYNREQTYRFQSSLIISNMVLPESVKDQSSRSIYSFDVFPPLTPEIASSENKKSGYWKLVPVDAP